MSEEDYPKFITESEPGIVQIDFRAIMGEREREKRKRQYETISHLADHLSLDKPDDEIV